MIINIRNINVINSPILIPAAPKRKLWPYPALTLKPIGQKQAFEIRLYYLHFSFIGFRARAGQGQGFLSDPPPPNTLYIFTGYLPFLFVGISEIFPACSHRANSAQAKVGVKMLS